MSESTPTDPGADATPARVLAALDPTAPSEPAEQLGLVLARATGAELVLGTVFPIIHLRSRVPTRHYESLLRREADRFLSERADVLRDAAPGVAVSRRATGSYSAARGLHGLARELGADLVVLGPSRRHGAGRSIPGPMGSRFAHGAPCPVVVASGGPPPERLGAVGAAFVPTADGESALRAAAALAAGAGASLRVIAVAAPLPWMDLVEPGFDGASLSELHRGHVASELERAVAELTGPTTVGAEVAEGDPVEVLREASSELDLLVCGSRGHGAAGEVVLGSVSHALLGAARCPVLIVPRSAPSSRAASPRSPRAARRR